MFMMLCTELVISVVVSFFSFHVKMLVFMDHTERNKNLEDMHCIPLFRDLTLKNGR